MGKNSQIGSVAGKVSAAGLISIGINNGFVDWFDNW